MLETIREYAAELLLEDGDGEAVGERHALWFLELAERAWAAAGTAEHPRLLDEVEREYPNVRAAVHWSLAARRSTVALRLAASLWEFWYFANRLEEGDAILSSVLELDATAAEASRAWALFGNGSIARSRGDTRRASERHAEAAAAFEALDMPNGIGASLSERGVDLFMLGELEAARECFRRGIAMLREGGRSRFLGIELNNYSCLLSQERRFDEASIAAEEALDLLREVGDRWGVVATTGTLAVAHLGAERLERARGLFLEELSLGAALAAVPMVSEALDGLATIEARRGRLAIAARLWGASEARLRDIGAVTQSVNDPSTEMALARAELGAQPYDAAFADGAMLTLDESVEYALSLD